MKRSLFSLPLVGAMMTASVAYAQTPPPAAATPPAEQTEPAAPSAAPSPSTEQDEVQPERGDCAEPAGQSASDGSTDDMQAALGTEEAPDADEAEQADSTGEEASAEESESETQPVAGADAGTAPGGAGSTGFTGGLGGSNIGTSQSEALDSSPQQQHPQVASGLDPISGETAVEGPQAPAELDEDAAITPTAPNEDAADC
ncbi:hypothetical protein [Aliihoeflea sp. 40Bstr573]|uniref:hypothetical protein n=1 Tax=Aliihoeflea sp. 40Bstr573 TaxID=2696467 RepID=UPI002095DFA9|nr:hypothetical protein [Aliihoeflea sp. 40Bstr573]MCO6388991.1 hypothetical protein [Aliihoeflea sp. 40Bstr573]